MPTAAALLALFSLLGSTIDAHVFRPSAGTPLNGIGVNPDIVAFAPHGIDFTYINLNRSILRRRHMQRQFRAARIPATRWPGTVVPLDSKDVTLGMQDTPGYPRTKNNFTRRQYAATLGVRRSHTAVVAHLLANGEPGTWHMVFEDDVTFPGWLFKDALQIMRHVPGNWDVIRFDCEGVLHSHPSFFDIVVPGIYRVHWGDVNGCAGSSKLHCWLCGGAFAVLYRHDSLHTVLQAIDYYVDNIDYDCLLSRAGRPRGPLYSYCIQLGLVDPWSGFPSERLGR
eukprot:EG_transcript_16683